MPLPPQIDPDFRAFSDHPEMAVVTQIRPISLISGKNQVQFVLPKMSDHAIDLSNTRLGIEFNVTKIDGTVATVAAEKYLSTINSQLSSFFQQISISLNNEHVTTCTNQHILSFLMQHLNYSKDYRKSILYTTGFEEAAGGEEGDSTGSSSIALASRIAKGKKNKLVGKIEHPFFKTQKLLPPNTELSLTLTQGSDDLFLMTDIEDKLKVNLIDCFLLVRLIKLEQSLLNAFQESLNKNAYILPYTHTTMKTYNMAKGESGFSAHNIHYGVIPSRIICLMVTTSSYLGTLKTTPLAFKGFNLNSHFLNYNGVNLPLIKINYDAAGDCTQLFEYVNNELKLNESNVTPFLEYNKFSKDFFILAQSLIDNSSVSNSTLPYTTGSISIELKFSTALTENVTLLIVSEFGRAYVSIDKNNTIQVFEK
jgi:hypothetical protein